MVRSGDVRVTSIRAINERNESVALDKQSTRQVVKMVKEGKSEDQIREFIRVRANMSPTSAGAKPEIRERRGIFGFLRRPFHKPETKLVVDLRRPVCLRGPCQICAGGQARTGGCGVGTLIPQHVHHGCFGSAVWSGSGCVLQTQYLDNCSGLRSMLERQAQRMQAAESIRRSACSAGASSECSETSTSWQSEQNLYQTLNQRYQQCRVRNNFVSWRGSFARPGNGAGPIDMLRFDASN
jgi:hypothetical protein